MSYLLSYNWSPNCTGGRGGNKINAIVLHHAATTNFDQIGATFQNKSRATSAHFGVAPGKVCQYVDINNTAWHCLPLDSTEVLTPDGFTLLGDLSVGDDVVAYDHETGNLKVSTVKRVVAPREEDVIRYKYIEATAQHKFLVKSVGSSNFVDKTWSDVVNGTQYVLPMPKPIETDGIDLTDDEIRYLVAVQADGSYVSPIGDRKTSNAVRFGFRKPRKIQRMKELLDRLGIDYKTYHEKNGKTVRYSISDWYGGKNWCEDYLDGKAFSDKFLGMNSHQTEVFFNELREWDGTININNQLQYTSTVGENVELVQALLFLSQGKSAHIYKSVGKGNRRDLYTIAVPSGQGHVVISSNSRDKLTRRVTTVSCIEVDTGYVVVRQHGLVFITGNCGNWKGNQQTIGIEHVNASGAPNWEISDETIKTGAELLANLAKQLGWSHLSIGGNVKFHSDFKSTYCPGKIRDAGLGAREVQLANEILGTGNIPQPSVQPQPKQQSNGGGYLSFDYRGNVREQPTTKSGVFATYNKGAWVKFDGYVHGEVVNGSDKWLRSSKSKKYVHESVTGGVYGLPDLGTVNLPSQPSNTPQTGSNGLIPQNGTYRANYNMKIRTAPSLSAPSIDTFSKGATHSYDGYVDSEGIRWISFIGDTTKKRVYVARRNFTTGEIYGECY